MSSTPVWSPLKRSHRRAWPTCWRAGRPCWAVQLGRQGRRLCRRPQLILRVSQIRSAGFSGYPKTPGAGGRRAWHSWAGGASAGLPPPGAAAPARPPPTSPGWEACQVRMRRVDTRSHRSGVPLGGWLCVPHPSPHQSPLRGRGARGDPGRASLQPACASPGGRGLDETVSGTRVPTCRVLAPSPQGLPRTLLRPQLVCPPSGQGRWLYTPRGPRIVLQP